MQKITENVYVETGFRGCNTSFVVTSEGVVIIDTPMVPGDALKWKAEAAKFGTLRYVINTEPHTDHAAGNFWFDAPVISHEGTRQALVGAQPSELINSLKNMAPDAPPVDPAFVFRLPQITFVDHMTLHLGKHTFKLLNWPGHTISETAVYIPEERVVFTGDNLNLNIPIFIKSYPHAWLDSLKKIQQLDVDKIVPGHGKISDKSCIPPVMESVQYWIDTIQAAINKGLTLEQTQSTVTMKERYPFAQNPPLNVMFRNSIADVYNYLKNR